MPIIRGMVGIVLAVMLLMAVGCDSESLRVSVAELDFGETKTQIEFEVYNANPERASIAVTLTASDPWISLDPAHATSAAPRKGDDGDYEYDATIVSATLDRTAIAGAPVEGYVEIKGKGLKKARIPVSATPPYEAIALSTNTLDIADDENRGSVLVTNNNRAVGRLNVYATSDKAWIDVSRDALSLTGVNASATMIIGVKRAALSGGYHEGDVLFEAKGFAPKRLRVRVFQPFQAIVTSNQTLDFGRNERPLLMQVWNSNREFSSLTISAASSHEWIEVLPATFVSAAPTTSIDPVLGQPVTSFDKQLVTVTIKRSRLHAGSYEGYVLFQVDSPLVAQRAVTIKVTQDSDPPDAGSALRIENPTAFYSSPYLVDFAFGLTDVDGNGFVAEPAQLTLGAFENGHDVTELVQPVLHRGASRHLRAEIVMDYSIRMRMNADAMDAMEYAATELFLAALPEEGMVGASLYHRDDLDPIRVTSFTLDHAYLAEQISMIQASMIGTFSSGSRMLDALRSAALRFDRDNVVDEERFILLLAGAGDTSSAETVERVADLAVRRHVKIHAVGFLNDLEGAAMMLDLASRTGGMFLPVGAVDELPRVMALIVDKLEANYLLRWATLKRQNLPVVPGFSVAFASTPTLYTAPESFTPEQIAGNVLAGRLRLVVSQSGDSASALLRAEYVPRNIARIRLIVASSLDFTVAPAPTANSGLVEHWHIARSDLEDGSVVIDMISPNDAPLPFATFGNLIRFEFAGAPPEGAPLFDRIEVDNAIEDYEVGGQFFTIAQ